MGNYGIDLDFVKKHWLNVLHDRKDVLIELLIKIALTDVQNNIDRKFDDEATWGLKPLVIDSGRLAEPLEAAVYMVIDDLYHNKTTQAEKAYFSNPAFERLVGPYRRLGV